MNKEIEIPEGYEARIEGNKVILEMKESEDERIRKALIPIVDRLLGTIDFPFTEQQVLDWFKKQKENPKSADSISSDCVSDAEWDYRWHKVQDFLPDNARLVLAKDNLGNRLLARYDGEGNWEVSVYDNEDYYCRNTITKWCEIPFEQKEQKPAELPKSEDYGIDGLYAAVDILQKTLGEVDGYQTDDGILEHKCAISAVKELYEQKPTEWSEEDEKMIERLIRHTQKEFDELCNDRYGHQEIISDLKESCRERMNWLENRLKSLRPSWKPSEEQTKVLKEAVFYFGNSWVSHKQEVLESLYNDIKKL